MPNFRKHPDGGGDYSPIENGGEMHLPCAVLVDTSSSMEPVKEQLREGLTVLSEALDDQARGRVEFCIISFDNSARVLVPFGPAYDFEVPKLECVGMTAMHAAVKLGLEQIETRKSQYKANQTSYYRPWIFLLTDGGANDTDNGSFEELMHAQKGKHCTFFPVAIGDSADKNLLKSMQADGRVLSARKEDFTGAFEWLSNSLSRTSNSNSGDRVKLPNPNDYQLEIEA